MTVAGKYTVYWRYQSSPAVTIQMGFQLRVGWLEATPGTLDKPGASDLGILRIAESKLRIQRRQFFEGRKIGLTPFPHLFPKRLSSDELADACSREAGADLQSFRK